MVPKESGLATRKSVRMTQTRPTLHMPSAGKAGTLSISTLTATFCPLRSVSGCASVSDLQQPLHWSLLPSVFLSFTAT